eukprot:COSAG06_NODE_42865_length_377_cov_1.424460_1_plen_90_part_10
MPFRDRGVVLGILAMSRGDGTRVRATRNKTRILGEGIDILLSLNIDPTGPGISPPPYAAQVHNADVERTRLCALQASLDGEPALPDSAAP